MSNADETLAPDYRSDVRRVPSDPQNQTSAQTEENHHLKPSYVNIVKSVPKAMFPKKDQAIVLNATEPLKVGDYVVALAAIIGPKNILFASRIANSRICIYLASSQMVDALLAKQTTLKVLDQDIGMRRLITPAKRLILSNVCPTVPHDIIESALKSTGLQLVSPVSFLRAGIAGEEFSHIFSFRRQVYVAPPPTEVVSDAQSSIVITYEGTQYRIFLSYDDMLCFLCRQKGHIASNCTNTDSPDVTMSGPPQKQDQPMKPMKRPPPSDSSTQSRTTAPPPPLSDSVKKPTHISRKESLPLFKKPKKSNIPIPTIPEESLVAIENFYKQQTLVTSIPFENLKSFLENCLGSEDPMSEAERFTKDIPALLKTLYMIYPYLPNRALKSRFTRISKRIREQLKSEELDSYSIHSDSSQHSHLSQEDVPNVCEVSSQSSQEYYY